MGGPLPSNVAASDSSCVCSSPDSFSHPARPASRDQLGVVHLDVDAAVWAWAEEEGWQNCFFCVAAERVDRCCNSSFVVSVRFLHCSSYDAPYRVAAADSSVMATFFHHRYYSFAAGDVVSAAAAVGTLCIRLVEKGEAAEGKTFFGFPDSCQNAENRCDHHAKRSKTSADWPFCNRHFHT